MGFKSGFVTIAGRPNVGKSTLLNLLTGEKIAIMSNKPQTTRHKVQTVVTTDSCQAVFIDTPGMHKPKNKLGEYMMKVAVENLSDVDIILFLIEATDRSIGPSEKAILSELEKSDATIILIINKVDLVGKEGLLPLIDQYSKAMEFAEIVPVSALEAKTKSIIMKVIEKHLPEGEKFYPDDMLTDQPEKVLAQEMIREKLLNLLNEEVPHGIGVEVISFKVDTQKQIINIDANIYCERDSHKGIVIGKNGAVLKKVGSLARADMERLFDQKVFLQLWVKVKDDWRNNDFMLNELGYKE